MTTQAAPALDEAKVGAFVGTVVGELGATLNAALVVIGDELGLYRAMAGAGPLTPGELAERTNTTERYVREWLNAQAAGGYVEYDPEARRYSLPPEHAVVLADEESPYFMPGAFQLMTASVRDEPRIREAFRSGAGVGWHEHNHGVFEGCERFFRPGYTANLIASWLPALDGVEEKLQAGASVADVGCGHGASTLLMAEAFPDSRFVGFDYHAGSIEQARKRAEDAGLSDRVRFEAAPAADYPAADYDLVTMFDCLHDMGDPVSAAEHVRQSLAADGTWLIVEPFAGDRVEDNLNPVGRVYYGASTLLCTPASMSQEVGLALGAQAGESKLRDIAVAGGFTRFRRAAETPFNLVLEARPEGAGMGTAEREETVTGQLVTQGVGRGGEQSRARYPDVEGFAERDGQRLFYEVYGDGDETLFLLPTWSLVHSRHWKMQIPYLARHFRVLVMDGLGNGRSDRCQDPRRYAPAEFARDCLAVMDATQTERAVGVGLSRGAQYLLELGRMAPERVAAAAFIGPLFPYTPSQWSILLGSSRLTRSFYRHAPYRWWGHLNVARWPERYDEFVQWWMERCFSEPHSTKGVEDAVGWALETDPKTMIATALGGVHADRPRLRELAQDLDCPVLVVHGDRDRICSHRDGRALARLAGGRLETVRGAGHLSHGRKPVQVNLALREFSDDALGRPRTPRDPTVHRPDGRPRALYVSSPIGLGHAQRDIAIARELRELCPDLQVDWLAQDPVTRVLAAEGERIHPASAHLANESRHIESESAEHDLHCFQALRRMDEILAANFMLFHDVVRDERYDLWIGDEAWELDYYLHENPGEKRAPFAWLTDFVGFLPMEDGGQWEEHLTTDHNAQMVEHVAKQPGVRDLALFVGNPDDIVDERLGPQLPMIRDWTERNFDFTGYVTGFDPVELGDRGKLRDELGYGDDEQVCIVTVGGSGVGEDLLRRVIAAFPAAKERVPDLRMVVVAGPRIDPASLPTHAGLEVVPYVHNLYRNLAACDLAVVQGGLTTSMELAAQKRPFLYFPLRHHFEQNFHVRHRLERYGAGRPMDFDQASPEAIANAIAREIGRDVDYRDVETDGAARAASRLAELL